MAPPSGARPARGARVLASSLLGALVVASLAALLPLPAAAQATRDSDTARLVVARPTVVAYLVVPPGAVDTMPDLATTADDWSYAMATLGDSLRARRLELALVTEPWLRVTSRGATPATLALGATGDGGYVFARPGAAPCVWRGWGDTDSVLAAATRFFSRSAVERARARRECGVTKH